MNMDVFFVAFPVIAILCFVAGWLSYGFCHNTDEDWREWIKFRHAMLHQRLRRCSERRRKLQRNW